MNMLSDPGFIELLFVYGVVLGIGIWQLVSIMRTLEKTRAAARDRDVTSKGEQLRSRSSDQTRGE